jgi:hypothetical protein
MNNIAEMLESIKYHIDNIDEDGFSNTKIVAVIKEIVESIKEALYG